VQSSLQKHSPQPSHLAGRPHDTRYDDILSAVRPSWSQCIIVVASQAYPTTDLAVTNVPTLASWLPRAVDENLLPEFEQRFCLAPVSEQDIKITDLTP
jgi:hypothetical protein